MHFPAGIFAKPAVWYIIYLYAAKQLERGGNVMDVQVGDVIQTKKQHPCGSNRFDVLRVGMDFKIRCQGCGREIMLPRVKIEKNIRKVLRGEG